MSVEQVCDSRVGWVGNEVAPAQLELPGAVAHTSLEGVNMTHRTHSPHEPAIRGSGR